MGRRMILMAVLLSIAFCSARAQKLSVSTNALGYADFLTVNAEASVAVARHWSVNAGFMYNPWSFRGEWGEMRDSRRTASAGTRFWFWNVYSGWWLGAKAQWEEYNRGGIRSPRTEEGDAFGVCRILTHAAPQHQSGFRSGILGRIQEIHGLQLPDLRQDRRAGSESLHPAQ